ncbi:hypothetical protein PMSD_04915 [Paenibacillus macquariensis subsp. defensor]|nr:hypothetical protein PMSD_04915 [Paenibacillus macquariensis subsp. defensor]
MTIKNVPTSFTAVFKKNNEMGAREARENFDMIMLEQFMDYVKANPDFFQYGKKEDATKNIIVQLLTI